jgi:hypothetical protein
MIKNYFLLLLLCPIFMFSQININDLYSDLDKNDMQTSILFSPILSSSGISETDKNYFNTYGYFQANNELKASNSKFEFAQYQNLLDAKKQSHFDNIIPIGIIYAEFDMVKEASYNNGDLTVTANNKVLKVNPNASIYEQRSKLIAAPFRTLKKGLSTTFKLDERFFINASEKEITSIKIDFGDNQGFKNLQLNEVVTVNYSNSSKKELQFQLVFSDGTIVNSKSSINIKLSNSDINGQNRDAGGIIQITASITPDLSAYGEAVNYPGQGEYQIFCDTNDGVLDKPIILIDGFDPFDSRDIAGLYSLLDFTGSQGAQNLGDLVRAEGFDLVILNLPEYTRAADGAVIAGGADFIERNAMLLVELINTINASKVGSEQNVIIGPSMGGLISRYALNYMENQSLNHDTRLWLSVDAPHHGANVPLGFQHQFNYLANGLGDNSVTELQPLVDGMLKSSAARQMLTDHFEPHLQGGSNVEFDNSLLTPEAHPWKDILDTNMNALTSIGFPENTRNISMINGSGIGNPYQDTSGNDILPGFVVLDDTFDVATATTAKIDVLFTPETASGSQPVSKIKVVLLGFITLYDAEANAQAFSYSDGIDAASGGLFDIAGLTEGLDTSGIVGDFLNALNTDVFNFIPSVSSMALEITNDEIDWFHDFNLPDTGDTINNTPFVNWYMPDDNEPHVQITEANVTFALDEILQETLSNNAFEESIFKIEKNPVTNELVILSSESFSDSEIRITDLTGKIILEKTMSLNNRSTIPVSIASGMYLLNIKTNGQTFQTKIVVK